MLPSVMASDLAHDPNTFPVEALKKPHVLSTHNPAFRAIQKQREHERLVSNLVAGGRAWLDVASEKEPATTSGSKAALSRSQHLPSPMLTVPRRSVLDGKLGPPYFSQYGCEPDRMPPIPEAPPWPLQIAAAAAGVLAVYFLWSWIWSLAVRVRFVCLPLLVAACTLPAPGADTLGLFFKSWFLELHAPAVSKLYRDNLKQKAEQEV